MADTTPNAERQRALARNHVSSILNAADHWAEPETCDAIVTAVLAACQNEDATHDRFTPEAAQCYAAACSDGDCAHARHAAEKDQTARRYWHGITNALEHLKDASNYDEGITPDDIQSVRDILRDSLDDGSFTQAERDQ